ncbi:transcriptional regulator [Pseudomonas aeruginosa]|nr:transcriptional regulator [Pseudomonas aeruginosa]
MPQTGQERDLPRFRSLPCAVYLRAFEMPAGTGWRCTTTPGAN